MTAFRTGFLTYIQVEFFFDFLDCNIRLILYQIIDILLDQLSLTAALINTKVHAAGLFHLLAQTVNCSQTYRKILGCLFGVMILFKCLY